MEDLQNIPVIDIQAYLEKDSDKWENECKKVASSLHHFGILIVKDPRVDENENDDYLDLVEKYFDNAGKKYYAGEVLEDCKPEFNY